MNDSNEVLTLEFLAWRLNRRGTRPSRTKLARIWRGLQPRRAPWVRDWRAVAVRYLRRQLGGEWRMGGYHVGRPSYGPAIGAIAVCRIRHPHCRIREGSTVFELRLLR